MKLQRHRIARARDSASDIRASFILLVRRAVIWPATLNFDESPFSPSPPPRPHALPDPFAGVRLLARDSDITGLLSVTKSS